MTIEASSSPTNNNHHKIKIRKILIPIDGSEYSLKAAKYAARIAKDENAELFCIHCIVGIPYGYINPASSTEQYYEDIKDKVESWFDEVRYIAKDESIIELTTETFMDPHSVINSILDYAVSREIDLIVIGTKGRTGFTGGAFHFVIKLIDMASIKFLKSEFTWCHVYESKRKVRDRALALR